MRGKQTHYIFSINISTIIKGSLIFMISLLSVFSIVGLLTALKYEYRLSSNSVNAATEHVKGETLYHLFAMENKLFSAIAPTDSPVPSVSELAFQFATNIRLQDPRSLLGRELPGFSIFDGKILVAGEGTNYTNIPIESQPPKEALDASNDASLTNTDKITEKDDEKKEPPALTTGGKKRVYLYFTHTRESYLPHLKGVTDPDAATHSTLNVTKVGDMLREELEDQGIGTHVDKTDIVDQLQKSGLNYSRSYQQSRAVVAAAQSSQKDLQYFIDIHRDSLRKDVTTATINGKSYAKLVFVVGAEHPNYEKNAELASDLHELLEKKYKGLSRGVILKKGKNTNGKFNQDLSENAMLVEFGGVDNTFEELNRTAEAFADVFAEYYWQAEQVNAEGK